MSVTTSFFLLKPKRYHLSPWSTTSWYWVLSHVIENPHYQDLPLTPPCLSKIDGLFGQIGVWLESGWRRPAVRLQSSRVLQWKIFTSVTGIFPRPEVFWQIAWVRRMLKTITCFDEHHVQLKSCNELQNTWLLFSDSPCCLLILTITRMPLAKKCTWTELFLFCVCFIL